MRRIGLSAVLLMVFCMASALAFAEEPKFRYDLSPYVGYHWYDERDLKDRPEFGLRLERFFDKNWGIEAGLGYVPTERNSDGDSRSSLTYMINGTYNFGLFQNKLVPYLTAGLGGDYTHDRGLIGPNGGAGLRYFFSDNAAIRAEVRDVYLFDKRNDVVAMLGFSWFFGKAKEEVKEVKKEAPVETKKEEVKEEVKEVPKAAAPLDSDNDGVVDNLDKCPGTPAGVKVDADGCPIDSDKDGVADYLDKCPGTPAGVKVDANGCPIDSDKDGVPDYLDKCPGTPAGVKVDPMGCPLDSDKDGVADYLDKCPSTPLGSKVDADGCVISVKLKVNFDTGKSVVKKQYHPEIEKFATYMKENPSVKAEIQGHTDNVGKAKANLKLSDNRARAVRDVLVKKFGIAADRLTSKGYGQEKPVSDNKTAQGRAENRRVEAVVTSK